METGEAYLGQRRSSGRGRHEELLSEVGQRLDNLRTPHGELVHAWYVLGLYQAIVREELESRGYRLERRNGEALWHWPTPWPTAAERAEGS